METSTSAEPKLQWYVVQAYAGFEMKAKQALEERIRLNKLQNLFGKVVGGLGKHDTHLGIKDIVVVFGLGEIVDNGVYLLDNRLEQFTVLLGGFVVMLGRWSRARAGLRR